MLALLLILIFIRPFISSLAFPYLNFIYSAGLLGFLSLWIITKGIPLKKIQSLKIPFVLFVLALLVSIVFSYDKINSLKESGKYAGALLGFLFAASLSREQRIPLLKTLTLSAFLIALLAIYQYFFGFRHLLDYLAKNSAASEFALDYINRKRVFFPFVTPNILAGYLAMLLPLTLSAKNRFWFIMPIAFALLLTQSIGALLSLAFASGIYFYLTGRLNKRKIISLIGLSAIVVAVFFIRSAAQKQHLQPGFSTVMRLHYWGDTLRIIKTKPLTGVGLGNFNLAESRYAHNSYLQIWAEMGILGLVSIIWLIISVLKPARSAWLISSCAVFLTHNLIDFSFFLPEVSLLWWIILGLLCGSQAVKEPL